MTNPVLFEAYARICGSLSIEQSLHNAFDYLKTQLPVDGAFINIYLEQLGQIRFLAWANEQHAQVLEKKITIPEHLQQALGSQDRPKLLRVQKIEDDPITHYVAPQAIPGVASFLMMRMELDQQHLGVIAFYSHQQNVFTQQHEDILAQLHNPFALVTANALHPILKANNHMLQRRNEQLQSTLSKVLHAPLDQLLKTSPSLIHIAEKISQIAPYETTVLIMGETGTGKEIIANTIHHSSCYANGPFIKVNCGAIPEMLIDSELFGHEKGAFTDAKQTRLGYFEQANGGTIFLDEIAELPPAAQVRLLRVLQNKTITRVGGKQPIKLKLRIIAATHKPLEKLVGSGDFREDLWYRLNIFPIDVPPLRKRLEDLEPLAEHFLQKIQHKYNLPQKPVITDNALEQAKDYPWPGNVRELENLLERMMLQGNKEKIDHLILPEGIKLTHKTNLNTSSYAAEGAGTLDSVTREYLTRILNECEGKIAGKGGAAEKVGLHPNTLRSRLKKLGLPIQRVRSA